MELCQFARQQLPGAAVVAHAGNGVVWGSLSITDKEMQEVCRRGLESLRRLAVAHHGNLTVPQCPTDWKRQLPVWGTPKGDWPLMKLLKEKLDPKEILNPGRMVS